jgi:hypothetical protein
MSTDNTPGPTRAPTRQASPVEFYAENPAGLTYEEPTNSEEQLALLTRQFAELNQKFQNLNASRAAPSETKYKALVPDIFDGTISKTKTFKRQLMLYFSARGNEFSTHKSKILFALSYMRGGNAGPWADSKLDDIERGENATPPSFPYSSYARFIKKFDDRFAEKDEAEKARHALRMLTQGVSTCDEYIAKFETLETLTGYNDQALIESFKQGLNRALVDRIFLLENLPYSLHGWKNYASRFDQRNRQRQEEVRRQVNRTFWSPQSAPVPTSRNPPTSFPTRGTSFPPRGFVPRQPQGARPLPPPPVKDSNAMDVDKASRAKQVMKGNCWKCNQPGHFARDCPQINIREMSVEDIEEMMEKRTYYGADMSIEPTTDDEEEEAEERKDF